MDKTLFIVAESKVNDHVGEEYDVIIEVPNVPTVENIQHWGNVIESQVKNLASGGNCVVVPKLSASSAFNAILINLQVLLKEKSNIEIKLPYLNDSFWKVNDPETNELLNQL